MKTRNHMLKKWTAFMLATVLCLLAASGAMAAGANRSLMHFAQSQDYMDDYITAAMEATGGIWVFTSGSKTKAYFFPNGEGEPVEGVVSENDYNSEPQEDGSYVYESPVGYFAWKGNVYQLLTKQINRENMTDIEGGITRKLVAEDGKITVTDSDLPLLDWTDMIQEDGSWKYSRYLSKLIVIGDRLVGTTYDDNGNSVLMSFDLTRGFSQEIEMSTPDNTAVGAFGENAVLMNRYEWNEKTICHVSSFDLDSENEEEITSITLDGGMPGAMCADVANNVLYYVYNGEVWAAPGMDMTAAIAVNDCPLAYDSNIQLLEDGNLLLYGQNTVVIRGTDPTQRADYALVVQDSGYVSAMREAMYTFSDSTGVPVIIRQTDATDTILQSMMNRDDQVDIYTLPVESSAFDALRNRGFLADLSGNEQLTADVQRMNPFAQSVAIRDGKLVAVPMSAYGNAMGYRTEVLKMLGEGETLPATWNEFFDWVESLPAKMEGKSLSAFSVWTTKWEFRYTILMRIMEQYQAYISQGDREYAFNTPLLRGLLERLAAVDLDALGLRNGEEGEEGGMWSEDDYKETLLETYAATTIETYNEGLVPLTLSLEDGAEPILPVNMTVAFVNPYSQHPEEAAAFLAETVKNLDTSNRYTLFSDTREPIRYQDYEEYKKNLQQWLEDARKSLEEAVNEEDKAAYQETVEGYEKTLAEIDDTYYMISPKSIEAYQNRVPYIQVLSYDLGSTMMSGNGNDYNDGYYQLVDNFANGQVTAEELLTTIDRKIQMMLLEGN